MSATLSNLYVEKASSEHPLALWMLNEPVDYVSQITNTQRNIYSGANWAWTNCDVFVEPIGSLNAPFKDLTISRIDADVPGVNQTITTKVKSVYDISSGLAASFTNLSIGFYSYIDSPFTNSISFGYEYTLIATDEVIRSAITTININQEDTKVWKYFSDTFDLPPDSSIAKDVNIVIEFEIYAGGNAGDYSFYINGLSLGQWSEEFNRTSIGSVPGPIPANIALPSQLTALPAYPYGASGENAYYLSHNKNLFCKNFGVPLVFGSESITKIYPNTYGINNPSLIFPGSGFLNKRGKNNDYTVEMWLRINANSSVQRKIFGPIASTDGLYVDGAFLSFKIGDSHGSHYVGEWFRPMLIHIRLLNNSLIVLLNGEEVIEINFDSSSLSLPEEYDSQSRQQDWLGFYAYEDVTPIDIDSFSIYSYAIPTVVAKRHWVWGQGVSAPEQTNSSINSITAYNDYAFANYASNYNYPDVASWKKAFFSNVNAGAKTLSLPDYKLPDFEIGSRTTQELFDDIQNIAPDSEPNLKYLTLKPNSSWSNETDFIHFNSLNVLNDPVSSIYGIFKTDGTAINEPLIKISNKMNGDFLTILLNGVSVKYLVQINGITTEIASKTVIANTRFNVGINLNRVSLKAIRDINRFFADRSSLEVHVAGDGSKKFTGKIYKIGFDAEYNNRKIKTFYDLDGIFYHTTSVGGVDLVKHTANYTLTALEKYGLFFADIAVAGYWEDYMPLSYFAKPILDYSNNKNYEIDSIQFNQDFPEPPSSITEESISGWTYKELQVKFSYPKILSYSDLDNAFYTKWENYEDMKQNSIKTTYYDTEDSILRSYISFQKVTDGSNRNLVDFTNHAKPLTSGILDPAGQTYEWENTAYELTTGTVIYPPTRTTQGATASFKDYSIVYHLDFKSEGIIHQPIRFRDLQLASHVLERTDFTPVGSKFGIPVYYYSRSGIYYDLKAKNPISTYKRSTPHLYLNRQSGWKLKGEFDSLTDRGLAIPINLPGSDKTEVSTMQMWVRFDEERFPDDPIMVFSISHNDGTYDFYIQGDSSQKRGRIFGVDRDSTAIISNIRYYINGNSVNDAYLVLGEWAVLGLEFTSLLDFSSSKSGKFNLNGPLTYNNISYNLATNIEKSEVLLSRTWSEMTSTYKAQISGALPYENIVSTTGTIGTVLGSGPWTSTITNLSSLSGFYVGGTIKATDGTGSLGNTTITITAIDAQNMSISFLTGIDGVVAPTAGTITDIKNNIVVYTANRPFVVGEVVTISNIITAQANPSNFNGTDLVVLTSTSNTFTVDKKMPISETYEVSSGGIAISGKWKDIKTELVVTDGSIPPFNWKTVKIISESKSFTINPKSIYQKYTGSDRIIIDDESRGILVKPDKINVHTEVTWSNTTKIPV